MIVRRLVLALAVLLLLPAAAHAATSVAIYSDPGDFLGQGQQDVFSSAAQINTYKDSLVSADHVGVGVSEPGVGTWSLVFAAPAGERLEARNYVGAQRAPFADPGRPGLSARVESRGCNEVYGRFEVRDLVRRENGSVRRLWVVFQLHCEGDVPASWGEIRINVPGGATTPGIVRWPEQDAWQTATTVPVRFAGGAALASSAIAGAHPGDFSADDGGCRATTCTVQVAFKPTAAGARSATLRLTDAAGAVHEVALEGFRHGGVTGAHVEDVITPATYVHAPPGARFAGLRTDHGLAIFWVREGDHWWEGRFWPGATGWQAGHTYTNPYRGSGGGPDAAFDVQGHDDVCNPSSRGGSFTVHSISVEPDGGLRTLDVSFEQPCYEEESQRRTALRGRFRYRAGDASPFADWLVPGPRPGLGPMEPEVVPGPSPQPPAGAPGGGSPSGPVGPAGAPRPLTVADAGRAAAACGGSGYRRLLGTGRADTLRGGSRADRLLGRGGADRLLGRGGGDCLHGSGGRDRLDGGSGRDALFGGSGDDLLIGGPHADVLDCGAGRRDRAVAGPGDRTRGCERVVRAAR